MTALKMNQEYNEVHMVNKSFMEPDSSHIYSVMNKNRT